MHRRRRVIFLLYTWHWRRSSNSGQAVTVPGERCLPDQRFYPKNDHPSFPALLLAPTHCYLCLWQNVSVIKEQLRNTHLRILSGFYPADPTFVSAQILSKHSICESIWGGWWRASDQGIDWKRTVFVFQVLAQTSYFGSKVHNYTTCRSLIELTFIFICLLLNCCP